ncbi:MAG: cyclic nucleotide-binding domain-containing protein [Deltaproteobacteria bacterium]|nr:cyclic nucleotide-binding domain-containing protein [Deltaproteobacteria bacterium]
MSASTTAALGDVLSGLPICVGLSAEERARLAVALVPVSVKKGDAVFKEGTQSNAMYLLARGKVEVRLLSREKPIATLKAPTVFGEMGVLTSSPHCATCIAATQSEIYALSATRFDELVARGDLLAYKLGLNLARMLAARLREVDEQLEGKSERSGEFASVRERLMRDWSY